MLICWLSYGASLFCVVLLYWLKVLNTKVHSVVMMANLFVGLKGLKPKEVTSILLQTVCKNI